MEEFERILQTVNDVVWSYVMIALLVGCALWFTFRTRFVQFRMMGEMVRLLLHSGSSAADGRKHISSFQAFVVALASRIGTGNLAGVATAISVGGPGAVFWMWVIALLGSVSSFIESTLAQLYKRKANDAFIGGPAYYMKYGLGRAWMGVLFAVLMVLTFGLAYNSVQSNTICAAWHQAFGISPTVMGIVLTALTLVIVFGGIHRVAKVSAAIVPFMAIVYMVVAVVIVVANIRMIPEIFISIVEHAFGIRQFTGGTLGMTVMQGIKRGLFSNEAGEGSTPNAAATAEVSHPVKQGLVQALGVFIDTLLVCSCTAFIILISGVDYTASNGIELTQQAISSQIGSAGHAFIAIIIWMFAFSSIIGNYYYGESNVRYITPSKTALTIYRLSVGAIVMIGSVISLNMAWHLSDLTMAMITACNLAAITPLSHQAVFLLKDYCRQKQSGRDPVFHKQQMPEIADKLEGWE